MATNLKNIGEFGLIDKIRTDFPAPEGMQGIGDDCAIIPQKSGMDLLVSTDMLMEGKHFLLDDITPYQLGWKSAAANFSDIAAMGGSPLGSFLALSLPSGLPDGWMDEFLRAYRDISLKYAFPLLGGDTTSSDGALCICVTVLGQAPAGKALRRSGAIPGDLICTTGPLGGSGGGLRVVLDRLERSGIAGKLLQRHYLPEPRMEEGHTLMNHGGVHAMMDISDGIASDLGHILEESGVGALVNVRDIPLEPGLEEFCTAHGLDPVELATSAGEDYELLFTIDPEAERSLALPHHVIGKITAEPGLRWAGGRIERQGYRHF